VSGLGLETKTFPAVSGVPVFCSAGSDKGAMVALLADWVRGRSDTMSGAALIRPTYHVGFGIGNDLTGVDGGNDPRSLDAGFRVGALSYVPKGGFKSVMMFNSAMRFTTNELKVLLARLMHFNSVPVFICQNVTADSSTEEGSDNNNLSSDASGKRVRSEDDKMSFFDLLTAFGSFAGKETTDKDGKTLKLFDVCLSVGSSVAGEAWFVGMIHNRRMFWPDSLFTTPVQPTTEAAYKVAANSSDYTHLYDVSESQLKSVRGIQCPYAIWGGIDAPMNCLGGTILPQRSRYHDTEVVLLGSDAQNATGTALYLLGFDVYGLSKSGEFVHYE